MSVGNFPSLSIGTYENQIASGYLLAHISVLVFLINVCYRRAKTTSHGMEDIRACIYIRECRLYHGLYFYYNRVPSISEAFTSCQAIRGWHTS